MFATPDKPIPLPLRRRSWFQFSLRKLLALMLLIGGLCNWAGQRVNRGWEHSAAVRAIEKLDGVLFWNNGKPHVPHEIDDSLVHLRALPELKCLDLRRTGVSDTGMICLRGLSLLEDLNLDGATITDRGLAHLHGMSQLTWLTLNGTRVSDSGLVIVGRLSQLKKLDLTGTRVTDAGLVHLRGLTQLECLCLTGTQVSDSGVAELEKALPNTNFFR